MFFWIIFGAIVAIVVGSTVFTMYEVHVQEKKWSKKVFTESLGVFLISLFFSTFIGALFFFLIGGMVKDVHGRSQVVNNEVYHIPENSTFDSSTKGQFSFTYIDSYGSFAAKTVNYDNLNIAGPKNSVVIVSVEDQYHDWFAPFVWGTEYNVLVH